MSVYAMHPILPLPLKLKCIFAAAPFIALLQAAGGAPDLTWVSQAERFGIIGFLAMACVFLARFGVKKDDQLVAMTKQMAEALVVVSNSNVELRKVIESSVKAKEELAKSIDLLRISIGDLPCTAVERRK